MNRVIALLIVGLLLAVVGVLTAFSWGHAAAAPEVAPRITDVSNSNTPNGLAGYITPGQTGFTVYSSDSSFGSSAGSVVLGTRLHYSENTTTYPQTVISWSAAAINVTISNVPASYVHGAEVFIFVINSAGSASLGFPVYIQRHTPIITGITSNDLSHGSVTTITGNFFGTRGDYHPDPDKLVFMWDSFNGDTSLASNSYRNWSDWTNEDQFWSNLAPRTSLGGDGHYRRTNHSSGIGGLETTIGNHTAYYYAAWMRPSIAFASSGGQVKFFRQWSIGSQTPNWYPSYRADNGWLFAFEFHVPEVTNSCESYEYNPSINSNQWIFFEMFLKRASGPNARDGEMWFKINNHLAFDWYKNFTINHPIPCYQWDNSGEFQDNGDYAGILQPGASYANGWTTASYADSDDIYYDASQARVMVSNASTFSASTAFELQLPVSWSDTAIQIRWNRGGYPSLSGKYLYIVDEFGIVNPVGYQLSAAPSPSATSTPPPTTVPTRTPTSTAVLSSATPAPSNTPFPMASATPPSSPTPAPFILEDFSTNFVVVAGGEWAVKNGHLELTNPANATPHGNLIIHNTLVPADFTLTTNVSVVDTSDAWNDLSIIFCYQNPSNYYFVSLNESNDSQTNGLFRYSNGVLTQLADFTSTITASVVYGIKVEKSGSTIRVYRDGTLLATAVDTTFSGGKVGFGSRNDSASYDDLVVTP